MSAINIDQKSFSEVKMSEKPVLIDFYAKWCGPCRMVLPIIDEIAEENSDVLVCKVNVDESPELAAEFGVYSIPTLVVMKNGAVVGQSVGAKRKDQILEMISV